ncbi:MAG: peptidase M16 [Rhodospirillaceae bacterium TMED167]|nr:peptidase M16 [Rhodospirillaceae bacterium]OUW27244.1 MAG: peptidase M16 [Rhodospirillaceae bacterium TMED167]
MTIRITTLDNGLRIITDPVQTVETASVGAWVEVGARHEQRDLNGVSHLLEHMAFKGTKRRSARAIVEEIEAVGGHLNAYTSRENTAYFAKVLKEDVPLAIDLIGDILQNSTLDQEELERERAVVIQEIHQANDTPDDIVFDRFQETAFPDQPMGRPILGSAAGIEGMPRATIKNFMDEQYSGNRIVVAAAGNVDHDAFVTQAKSIFTQLPPNNPHGTEPVTYRGGDYREKRDLEQVHLVMGFDGISHNDPDYYPLAVLSTLLGGGMSSRLFQEAREKRGLVYSIYTFASSYEDGGLFGIYAGTGGDDIGDLVPVICDEVKNVRESVHEGEVMRARAQLKSSTLMALESTSARCEQAARQLQIYGSAIPNEEVIEKIDAVDTKAVMRVAGRLFTTIPTVAAIGPTQNLAEYDRIQDHLN